MNTKFGWHFIGKPPDSFRAQCDGSNGIKVVGNEADLMQLKDWSVFHKQARLITAESLAEDGKNRNNLDEIPQLVDKVLPLYKGAADKLGLPDVWWEIPPIMPPATRWVAEWNAAMVRAMKKAGLRSVALGFPLGYPNVKPFDTPDKPDEWPILYPTLEAIHEAGRDWSRLGVQEYIINGVFDPANKSSTLRLDYVYQYHIIPHGWLIDTSIIECGWDIPGMRKIKGMSPTMSLDGLRRLDAEYAKRPWVAVAYLYAVVDPLSPYGEGDFAFTPGDKKNPMGYLETFKKYFYENPPVPFSSGSGTPPTPEPEKVVYPTLVNANFEDNPIGKWNANQVKIPGWVPYSMPGVSPIRFELEEHPPHVVEGKRAARIVSAYEIHKGGIYQTFEVPLDGEISAVVEALSWSLSDPQVGNPTEARMNLKVGIDPTGGADPSSAAVVWSADNWVKSDAFGTVSVSGVKTAGRKATIFLYSESEWPMTRNDSFWDRVVIKVSGKETDIPTNPARTSGVVVNCNFLNVRSGPGTSHSVIFQLVGGDVPEKVTLVSVADGWGRLVPRPKYPDAYVSMDYIKI